MYYFAIRPFTQDRICNGNRKDSIVSEVLLGWEGIKIIPPCIVEFVGRTDDIADDGSKHYSLLFNDFILKIVKRH